MAQENHCPQCGAELAADAPQEQCPKCLMKLGLLEIPIGTAVGIYTLWVILNDNTARLFAQTSGEK
jgi:Zn finger protein HypA/HybF involved in hydrogenase expression